MLYVYDDIYVVYYMLYSIFCIMNIIYYISYTYVMECQLSICYDEIFLLATRWMNFEVNRLSEIRDEKDKDHMISLICRLENIKKQMNKNKTNL